MLLNTYNHHYNETHFIFSIWTCFLEGENENSKKMNKITKFVINLPEIMKKAKRLQEMTLIMIEIGP